MSGEKILVIDDSPTILKVVQLVLAKAGYSVTTAPDGEAGLAAARETRPDLILLDFVMPGMNGYQVCRALAAEEALGSIPVVLMSAKGDQVGERFVRVMGIVDYITKPFSPEAITAVVAHTLAKGEGAREEAALLASTEVVPPAEVEDDSTQVAAERERQLLADAREEIARTVAGPIADLVALSAVAVATQEGADNGDRCVPTDAAAVREAARRALSDMAVAGILAAGGRLTPIGPHGVGLAGDLSVVPLSEALQLLAAQGQSGVLEVSRGGGKVEIFFRQGRIDLATAMELSEEFLLGRFVVAANLMTKTDFDAFLRTQVIKGKLLGAQLVKLGYLSPADLKQVLARQTHELVYEVLRWGFGRFAFRATRDVHPLAVEAALGLDVEGLLMEGFRRVDEWHLIEREVDSFDLVFVRNDEAVSHLGRERLTREELAVLELVNGKNNVKEIIRQSRMGSFDVSKMIYRLQAIKLIRRRVMPVAV